MITNVHEIFYSKINKGMDERFDRSSSCQKTIIDKQENFKKE